MIPIDIPQDFAALSRQCAPTVHVRAMHAIVNVESSFRQFAIAVVDGPQVRTPRTMKEAIQQLEALDRKGYNYSVGYAQVNKYNFKKQGLTFANAFDACANLGAGSRILEGCFRSARKKYQDDQVALRAAFSCYYSGNFLRGFRPDRPGVPSYVDKVLTAALGSQLKPPIPSYSVKLAPQDNRLGAAWSLIAGAPKKPEPRR